MVNRKIAVLMVALFIMALPALTLAGTVDLPQTGQTTCYDASGNVIACAGTGQDGDIQAGVAWPSPRFTDNRNGTVTDNLTGLIWLKNANCFGSPTWANALNDANTLNSGECGLSDGSVEGDWRLPNVNELESLINAEQSNPATWLNGQGFSNVQAFYYWSSTTVAEITDDAWLVCMWDGGVINVSKESSFYVWPVRAGYAAPADLPKTGQTASYATGDDGDLEMGVAWPSPRFTDNGNGTVTDNLTGLIWLKNANCFGSRTWANALNDANTLNSGECGLSDGSVEGDWRLPNRKELRSLVDYSKYNPALITGHPFSNVQASYYWSSTTDAYSTHYAWDVSIMWSGYVGHGSKDVYYYVWPVRAGQVGSFYDLVITKSGTGTGTVTSNPAGITCGGDCSETYNEGTAVTLTPTPDAGSTFAGWSGDDDCSDGQVTMDSSKTCTATFTEVCPATAALKGALQQEDKLGVLYAFRDKVLAKTPTGERYITLFYKHAVEVVWLMVRHPDLRARSRALLERFLPTLQAILARRPATMTHADLAAIEALLQALAAKANPQLQADLKAIQEELQQGAMLEHLGIRIQ